MTQSDFPPHIAAALDLYAVPPVPHGFADRLIQRLATGTLPAPELPFGTASRRPQHRGASAFWRRPGRVLLSAGAIGLATATAAASGLLGERVYVPVVSALLEQANIVPASKPVAKAPARPKPVAQKEEAVPDNPPLTGQAAVREMRATLRNDPEFRVLSAAQKAERIRAENRALVLSGRATPEDIRAVRLQLAQERKDKAEALPAPLKQKARQWRERYEAASTDEQAAMRAEAKKRREERLARRRGQTENQSDVILSPVE